MSRQIRDPFIWNHKTYIFTAAEDIDSLFDPAAYGLHPTPRSTACRKGFVLHFQVTDNRLYLEKLEVYCGDSHYPSINGVTAREGERSGFYTYDDLNLPLEYTGTIVLGAQMSPLYFRSAFPGPHSYEHTYDLRFTDGTLSDWEDTTGKYFRFR